MNKIDLNGRAAINSGAAMGIGYATAGRFLDSGVAGGDIRIGAEILIRAALTDEFEAASGQYFDNDSGQFASPHPDALDPGKWEEIVRAIEAVLSEMTR